VTHESSLDSRAVAHAAIEQPPPGLTCILVYPLACFQYFQKRVDSNTLDVLQIDVRLSIGKHGRNAVLVHLTKHSKGSQLGLDLGAALKMLPQELGAAPAVDDLQKPLLLPELLPKIVEVVARGCDYSERQRPTCPPSL
jgi:hypothetical protein